MEVKCINLLWRKIGEIKCYYFLVYISGLNFLFYLIKLNELVVLFWKESYKNVIIKRLMNVYVIIGFEFLVIFCFLFILVVIYEIICFCFFVISFFVILFGRINVFFGNFKVLMSVFRWFFICLFVSKIFFNFIFLFGEVIDCLKKGEILFIGLNGVI